MRFDDSGAQVVVEGSHDGYAHLAGAPRHHRRWRLDAGALEVDDRIEPSLPGPATARLHFAPGLELAPDGGRGWRLNEGGTERARLDILAGGTAAPTTTQHALRFGERVDATTLELELADGRAAVRITWPA